MKKNIAYTIVSKNYLGQALTAFASFKKYDNPDYDFRIFVMDMIQSKEDIENFLDLKSKGVDITFWSEVKTTIPDVDYEDMLFKYDVIEMNTAIKPYIMEHLYNSGYSKVIYFDPDICFYQPINELDKMLDKNDIILTPHCVEPIPDDGKRLSSIDIIRTGVYNCGFIATKNTENTKKMYKFWQEHLFSSCFAKQDEGMFTDQIWAQWFPCLFDKVLILKDKGYNGAYWNLHERLPEFKDGNWYMGTDNLIFYHFSGFNPKEKDVSKYQTRFTQEKLPEDYVKLSNEYAKELLKNNYLEYKTQQYYYDKFLPSGYLTSKLKHRRLLSELFYSKDVNPFLNDAKNKLKIQFKDQKKLYAKLSLLIRASVKVFVNKISDKKKQEELGINIVVDFKNMSDISKSFIKKNHATGIPYTITDISDTALNVEFSPYKKFISKKSLYKINLILVDKNNINDLIKRYKNIKNGQNYLVVEDDVKFDSKYVKETIKYNVLKNNFVENIYSLILK